MKLRNNKVVRKEMENKGIEEFGEEEDVGFTVQGEQNEEVVETGSSAGRVTLLLRNFL